jgi:hypothetical protein
LRPDAGYAVESCMRRNGSAWVRRLFLFLALLAVLWISGAVGRSACWVVENLILPVSLGDVEIYSVRSEEDTTPFDTGLRATVAMHRLGPMLHGVHWAGYLVPPGFLRNGMVLRGSYALRGGGSRPVAGCLPFEVRLDRLKGDPPRVVFKCPADLFNALVAETKDEDLRSEARWVLGHVDLVQQIEFRALRIAAQPAPTDHDLVGRRVLEFQATGRTRYRVEEQILRTNATLDLRTTVRIRDLAGRIVLDIEKVPGGSRLQGRAYVDVVRADVNRVAPWLDRSISEQLRESFERSLNRTRNRKKVERLFLPDWAPLDLDIDISLVPRTD